MYFNIHAHTFRCHHAEGEDREYIERAIGGGIKKMGFSDHIPFAFPDGHESGYRVCTADAEEYIGTIKELAKEYTADIELHVGFESEYYPLYFDEMFANAAKWGAEYLILGQHFTRNEWPDGFYSGWQCANPDELHTYCDEVVAAIGKGVFTCVAHPDIFNFVGDESIYESEMRRVCEAAKRTGTPLEINLLGIRTGRQYPCERFWRIAGEIGCDAVLGCDAHEPRHAYDGDSVPKAEELASRHGVRILDEIPLLPLVK